MTFFSRFRILCFVAVRAWREPVLIFIERNLFPAVFAFILAFSRCFTCMWHRPCSFRFVLSFEYPREKVSKHRPSYACKTARSLQSFIKTSRHGFSTES